MDLPDLHEVLPRIVAGIIAPVLRQMGPPYHSEAAVAQLACTAWTEGLCRHRDQLEKIGGKLVPGKPGPAYSWFQIERPTFQKMADQGGPEEWPDLRPQLDRWGLLPWLDQPGLLLTLSEAGATIAARGLYWSDYWSRRKALVPARPENAAAAARYYIGTWRPAASNRRHGTARFKEAWPLACELAHAHA